MVWSILADAVLVLHGVFVAWAVLGGLAVLHWPRAMWLHLPALAWGIWIEATAGICPLTPLESWLRVRAGQAGLAGSFIDHYLGALIYPQGLTPAVQGRLALGLALFNAGVYAAIAWRAARRRRMR
jgi:hypothetical protein